MKKLLFVISAILVFTTGVFAQAGRAPLSKGEKQLNFGLGFSTYGFPVYGIMDFAVHDDVTVGPLLQLRLDDDMSFIIAAKADYHWNRLMDIPREWDFYTGGRLGMSVAGDLDLDFGIQVGGRWYWDDKWALNLEFGGGMGFGGLIGVSMKL